MNFQDKPDVVGADRDQVSMAEDYFRRLLPVKPVKQSYFNRPEVFFATYYLGIGCFNRPEVFFAIAYYLAIKQSYFNRLEVFFAIAYYLAITLPYYRAMMFLTGGRKITSVYDRIRIMSTADKMHTALKIAKGKRLGFLADTVQDAFTTPLQDLDGLGLQVLEDGKWDDVKPHPGAFVTKKGNQLQVITYGASAKDIKKILCAVLSALKEKNSYLGWGPFGTLDLLPSEPSGFNFGGIIFCAPVSGSSSISSRVWILDTGATHHVCSSPSSFQYLDLSVNPVVTVANGQTVSAAGIGSVRLSEHLTLENVLFVPEFHLNVVSVSALTQQHHYTAIFTSDYYVILDLSRGQIILLGRRSGNLYVLN